MEKLEGMESVFELLSAHLDSKCTQALSIFNGLVINGTNLDPKVNRREALRNFEERHLYSSSALLRAFRHLYPHWFRYTLKAKIFSPIEMTLLFVERQHSSGGYEPCKTVRGWKKWKKRKVLEKYQKDTPTVGSYVESSSKIRSKKCLIHADKPKTKAGGFGFDLCLYCKYKLEKAELIEYVKSNGVNRNVIAFLKDVTRRPLKQKAQLHIWGVYTAKTLTHTAAQKEAPSGKFRSKHHGDVVYESVVKKVKVEQKKVKVKRKVPKKLSRRQVLVVQAFS